MKGNDFVNEEMKKLQKEKEEKMQKLIAAFQNVSDSYDACEKFHKEVVEAHGYALSPEEQEKEKALRNAHIESINELGKALKEFRK